MERVYSAKKLRLRQGRHIDVLPAGTGLETSTKKASKHLYVLMAVVALVLLSGCLNIANLLLARTAARQREIAVRLALGVAFFGSRILASFLLAGQAASYLTSRPTRMFLPSTLLVGFLTGILFGIAPAPWSARVELSSNLKGEESTVFGRLTWPKAFVSFQVALSLLLLIGAGLFLKSLNRLHA